MGAGRRPRCVGRAAAADGLCGGRQDRELGRRPRRRRGSSGKSCPMYDPSAVEFRNRRRSLRRTWGHDGTRPRGGTADSRAGRRRPGADRGYPRGPAGGLRRAGRHDTSAPSTTWPYGPSTTPPKPRTPPRRHSSRPIARWARFGPARSSRPGSSRSAIAPAVTGSASANASPATSSRTVPTRRRDPRRSPSGATRRGGSTPRSTSFPKSTAPSSRCTIYKGSSTRRLQPC